MNSKLIKILLFIFLGATTLFSKEVYAQVPASCEDVMLQAFDYYPEPINLGGTTMTWNDSKWTTLNNQATEIGESFQMIWLPPSARAEGHPTTMGYHPQYYFNQNSTFGTQEELIALIANLKTKNCKAIADIVVNHRSSPTNWCDFAVESYKGITYTPNSSWICTNDESRSTAPAGCNNPTGGSDSGETYPAARDLDHTNSAVRDNIKAYMQFLKNDIGYSGWRYDVAKGFAQSYVAEYNDAAAGTFSVGEVMETSYDYCKTWINNTNKKSTAFDFPCQAGIREALNNSGSPDYTKLVSFGQPRGLIAADMKRYAVTFVENHDTYRYNLGFYGNIEVANAFILSSPGVPCVYLPHWNKYKTNIKKMVAARKKAGVHSESVITNIQSATNIYVARATGTNGELIVKLGSGSYSAPAGFTLECSGTDWAIWTNISSPTGPTASISPAGGYYSGGTTVTLFSTGGVAPVKIYYTTNGTTPTASSTLYSAPFSVTDATVNAIAIDNSSIASAVVSETYTTVAPSEIKVYFKVPTNWSTVKVWAWKGTTNFTGGVWPGSALTVVDGFVEFSTPATNTGFNIIFNNGGNNEQTVDITNITATNCYETTTFTGTNPKKYNVQVISGCTTNIDTEIPKPSLSIYPNPAKESFTIESDLTIEEVKIYSINGMMVKSEIIDSSRQTINISDLSSGYYSVVIVAENGTRVTSKLIKR